MSNEQARVTAGARRDEVSACLEGAGKMVNVKGANHDTLRASVRAHINALNKLLVKREKTVASALPA